MMNTKLFLLCIALFLIGALVPATCFSNGDSVPLEWEAFVSSQATEFIKVVETRAEWSDLWKRALGQDAPEVDFENNVVACVFLGYSAQWLYSIAFDQPFMRDNQMVIPYALHDLVLELAGPFKAGGQYCMRVFKKAQGVPMILEKAKQL